MSIPPILGNYSQVSSENEYLRGLVFGNQARGIRGTFTELPNDDILWTNGIENNLPPYPPLILRFENGTWNRYVEHNGRLRPFEVITDRQNRIIYGFYYRTGAGQAIGYEIIRAYQDGSRVD